MEGDSMKYGKIFLVILGIMLVASPAYAINFNVDLKPIRNQIFLDQSAVYSLSIENTGDHPESYQLYTTDISWYVSVDEPVTELRPGERKTLNVTIAPNVWTNSGPQKATFVVKAVTSDQRMTHELPIFVRPWDYVQREYVPSFELGVDIPEEIDPRVDVPIRVSVRNRNRLNADNIDVIISSDFFTKRISFPLGPLEEKSEEFIFSLEDDTPPQQGELSVLLFFRNESVNSRKEAFRIVPYSELVKSEDLSQYLFKSMKEIKIRNVGNIQKEEKFRVETGIMESLFSKTEPKAEKVSSRGASYFEWDVALEPQAEKTIYVHTNYRAIPLFLIFALLGVTVYYITRSPVVSRKEALVIHSPSSGISELKIVIHVKNRTQDVIDNVHVTDKIPSIAELIKETNIGTIEPTKILNHDKKGTLIKWELLNLEPFEERIITYRMKSRLNIVGGIHLPSTKIKFDTKGGRERIVSSNACEVRLDLA